MATGPVGSHRFLHRGDQPLHPHLSSCAQTPEVAATSDPWRSSCHPPPPLDEHSTFSPPPQPRHCSLALTRRSFIHHAAEEAKNVSQNNFPKPRFVRTDQWIPVYSWLESLETSDVVKSKDISEWLSEHPNVKDQLYARHSRYHLMHYIQKMHLKMLRKREKLKDLQPIHAMVATSNQVQPISNGHTTRPHVLSRNVSITVSKDDEMYSLRKHEALIRYELFTDLQMQLTNLLAKHKKLDQQKESSSSASTKKGSTEHMSCHGSAAGTYEANPITKSGSASPAETKGNRKRKIHEPVPPTDLSGEP